MKPLISTIKNPLTTISVFAGITESVGVGVLPFLDHENQRFFLCFLVSYPYFLVVLFFVTLWWKREALYGPGDYDQEENFMRHFEPATLRETRERDLTISVSSDTERDTLDEIPKKPFAVSNSVDEENDSEEPSKEATYEEVEIERRKKSTWLKDEAIRLIALAYPGLEVFRDLKLVPNKGAQGYVFDAVINPNSSSPKMVAISELGTVNKHSIKAIAKIFLRIQTAIQTAPKYPKNGSVILAVIIEKETPSDSERINQMLREKLKDFPVEFSIRIFQRQGLETSWKINWAFKDIS